MRLPATKARRVLAALLRIGWSVKRETDDEEEIGPRMLARMAKKTGLSADDL